MKVGRYKMPAHYNAVQVTSGNANAVIEWVRSISSDLHAERKSIGAICDARYGVEVYGAATKRSVAEPGDWIVEFGTKMLIMYAENFGDHFEEV